MAFRLSVQEAASLWGCSVRRVQMLCKQGRIPGAQKVSGVWLLPENIARPEADRTKAVCTFRPEQLYGRNAVVHTSSDGDLPETESGCTIDQYQILDGIILVFQDIHEETLDYGEQMPQFPEELIAIQHCREGRFEGAYSNGEYIYMGPGSLSINLPAWAPVSNSFPLGHYHGLYLAISPKDADASIRRLEQVLGPLHIDLLALSGQLSDKNRLAFYECSDQTAQLLSNMYTSRQELRAERLRLQVLQLLQMLSTQRIRVPAPERYFTREQVDTMKKIRQYLISHLDQHIALPRLAADFRISLTGMKACFKGVYGQSVGRYLREYRMQAGAEQLTTTGLKIIEIAANLGYENASKFSEAFAAYYGMTPSTYRKTRVRTEFCPTAESGNGKAGPVS